MIAMRTLGIIALGLVLLLIAVLLAVGFPNRDYSAAAFWLGGGVLLYFCLLRIAPAAARIWLCVGAGLAGAFVVGEVAILLVFANISDGWGRFGATIWIGPPFMLVGAVAGFWVAFRWTKPAERQNRLANFQ